jgi:serine/threonine protein kinase
LSYQGIKKPLNTALPFAAPETLLRDETVTPAVDIWALACTFYQLFSMNTMFEEDGSGADDVISDHVVTFGKLPQRWWDKWSGRSKYFSEDMEFAPDFPKRMEELTGSVGMEEKEAAQFTALLRGMMKLEPEERFTAREVLENMPTAWMDGK